MNEKNDMDLLDINLFDTEITINPNYYLHLALINSQKALISEDIKQGMDKYVHIVNHAEVIAKSSGTIGTDYDNQIKEFRESDEYLKTPESIKNNKLANKKLALITKGLFDSGRVSEKLIL